jgi:hypothetical protein
MLCCAYEISHYLDHDVVQNVRLVYLTTLPEEEEEEVVSGKTR